MLFYYKLILIVLTTFIREKENDIIFLIFLSLFSFYMFREVYINYLYFIFSGKLSTKLSFISTN